jgi:hypothetical protein
MPNGELIALMRRRMVGQPVQPKNAGFFSSAGAR